MKSDPEKHALELKKLKAEIEKLDFENSNLGPWIDPAGIALLGFAASVIGAWLTIRSEQRKLLAEFDHATHEKRLECYPELTKATSPLALFFPSDPRLDRSRCLQIGSEMSRWYFTVGGLVLSREARDEYFRLARAVTKAFDSDSLLAPVWEQYAKAINDTKMDEYRKELGLSLKIEWNEQIKKNVESWTFGKLSEAERKKAAQGTNRAIAAAYEFKDFVLLQTLSSRLRSALSEDIASRRRPFEPLAVGAPVPHRQSSAQNAASSNAGSTERPHGPS